MGNEYDDVPNRNSEDKVPADHRGKELLELCKSLQLVILNGRKIGDLFGKFTSLQWNGNSVVDYVLVSKSIYSSITYFQIGNFIPWLSDHCATRFKIRSCMTRKTQPDEENPGERIDSLFWNADSPGKFTSILSVNKCLGFFYFGW